MSQNAPLVEFVTTREVSFRVICEKWGNHKEPTHPIVLERYDGECWREVDRWDMQKHENDSEGGIQLKDDEQITTEAVERIESKTMFDDDGDVKEIDRRF